MPGWTSGLGRWPLWLAAASGRCSGRTRHGSFPLLAGVLAIVTVAALIGRERRWWQAAVATGIAARGAGPEPVGPGALRLRRPVADQRDHRPAGRGVASATAAGTVVPAVHHRRRRRAHRRRRHASGGPKGRAPVASPTSSWPLAFLVLALRSGRHVMLFGVAAAPLLAIAFAAVGRGCGSRWRSGPSAGPAVGEADAGRPDVRRRLVGPRTRHRRPRRLRRHHWRAGRRWLAAGRPQRRRRARRRAATRSPCCPPSMT